MGDRQEADSNSQGVTSDEEGAPGSLRVFEAGQSEDLVARLRGLVRAYPADIGLIKEFLQNADDAGATWIRFTLDLREHPGTRLPDPRMAKLMGPALLVSSDQAFRIGSVNLRQVSPGRESALR